MDSPQQPLVVGSEAKEGGHTNDVPHDDPIFSSAMVKNPSSIYVWGISTPKALNCMSQLTPMMTDEDVDFAAEDAIGKPIFLEHTFSEPLGRVIRTRVNKDKQIEFVIEFENTPEGYAAADTVYEGKSIGVSWGGRHKIVDDTKLVKAVADKKLVELSLTSNPEFPEAKILGISSRDKGFASERRKLLELVKGPDGEKLFGEAARYLGMYAARRC